MKDIYKDEKAKLIYFIIWKFQKLSDTAKDKYLQQLRDTKEEEADLLVQLLESMRTRWQEEQELDTLQAQ